ncbi:MAG: DUF433 domain-containing protein [Deltaproteobacteria bacterium]|nr:DUF433 domain-containing protein [Deltaproteobacteria bacterium]
MAVGSDPEERIMVDPRVCAGKPCIRGTRIMVKNILGMFAGGYSIERILSAYPELSREDVVAALDYATRVIDEEKVIQRA